jgi:hypothetical protein
LRTITYIEDARRKANRTIFKQLPRLFCHAYSHTLDLQAQTIKRHTGIGGIEWHGIIRRDVSQKDSVDQMKQAAIHPGFINTKQPMCANSNSTFKGQRHGLAGNEAKGASWQPFRRTDAGLNARHLKSFTIAD